MIRRRIACANSAFVLEQPQAPEFHDLVHYLQNLGYDGIEFGCFAPHPTPESLPTREARTKFQRLVTSHSLNFSALVPDLRGLSLVEAADAGPYVSAIAKHLELAADLGIATMCIGTGADRAGEGASEPALERAVAALDRCAKMAATKNVVLAWEFEPASPLGRPSQVLEGVRRVRDELGNTNFGVLLDTANLARCTESGQELEFLKMLHGKITHVHIADTDGTRVVPLGKGRVPLETLLPELAGCSWWCIDLGVNSDPLTAAEDSKRFLDKLCRRMAI
jgi:sugar phosphate isomerase/epimerase